MPTPIILGANWHGASQIKPRKFTCGSCSSQVASDRGFYIEGGARALPGEVPDRQPTIVLCPMCTRPTFFVLDEQHPGPLPGALVQHLPANVEPVYTEARRDFAVGSFMSVALVCRSLLMHVAVDALKEPEGKNFTEYVDALVAAYAPRGNAWVDRVRKLGNAGTHRIDPITREDATAAFKFSEMILRLAYEYPTEATKSP